MFELENNYRYNGDVEVYSSYEDFCDRKDKDMNGVSIRYLMENKLKIGSLHLIDCKGCWNSSSCVRSNNLKNCKEVHFSENCEDCYFIHDCESCSNSTGIVGKIDMHDEHSNDTADIMLLYRGVDDFLIL